MKYEIKNNLPILLEWKDKKNYSLIHEPNYTCCTYDLNDYGYRASHDYEPILNQKNKIICVGCSFTFGTGLDEEQTWPYKLNKILGGEFMNLGYPGGSMRYILWQLNNIKNKIPNKQIFVLIPPLGRSFKKNKSQFFCENHKLGLYQSYLEHYYLKLYCKINNIVYLDYSHFGEPEISSIKLGIAKDGTHYGEEYQTAIAKQFVFEMIYNEHNCNIE